MTNSNFRNNDNGGEPAHVHIVEDNRLMASTMMQGLTDAGYRVSNSESAEECLQGIENDSPDIAVIDMGLPGKSGMDLARKLRDEFSIPFMFLTANDDADVVNEAIFEGALVYLVKPVGILQLVPAVGSSLARSREIKALQGAHGNLTEALEKGREVSVAIGLLMERHHINHDEAFEELRYSARSQRKRLTEIAQNMMSCAEALNMYPRPKK